MLETLYMKNFKSFRKEQCYTFVEQPGFYLVSGVNLVDQSLEGNGAGKSSLWDAVVWCLYGKTARGVRASNVVSWGQNSAIVALTFTKDNVSYEVKRVQSPNSLTVNDIVVTQSEVDDLIGLNYFCFMHGVLMGQFNPFFFDLGPTDKLALFSEILDLDSWNVYADKAKSLCEEVSKKAMSCEYEVENCDKQIEFITQSVEASKVRQQEWLVEVEGLKQQLIEQIVDKQTKYTKNIVVLEEVEKKRKEVPPVPDWTSLDLALDSIRQELSAILGELSAVRTNRDHYHAEKSRFKKMLDDKICYYCGRSVNEQDLAEKLLGLDNRIVANDKELVLVKKVVSEIEGELKQKEMEKRKMLAEYEQVRQVYDAEVAKPFYELSSKISWMKADLEEDQKKLKQMENKTNPYVEEVATQEMRLDELLINRKVKQQELSKAKELVFAYRFWQKTFKEIRLWIVNNCLREYEIEVNNTIAQLGLAGWLVEFDVEKETKSGGVSKGFTVNIRTPNMDCSVPWESWSGGETQRLRLAGSIGLANLIRSRTALPFDLEVWDEPTAHLSAKGIDDMLAWFKYRAEAEQKSIYLVDHRSLDKGLFSGEVKVIKSKDGSEISNV